MRYSWDVFTAECQRNQVLLRIIIYSMGGGGLAPDGVLLWDRLPTL